MWSKLLLDALVTGTLFHCSSFWLFGVLIGPSRVLEKQAYAVVSVKRVCFCICVCVSLRVCVCPCVIVNVCVGLSVCVCVCVRAHALMSLYRCIWIMFFRYGSCVDRCRLGQSRFVDFVQMDFFLCMQLEWVWVVHVLQSIALWIAQLRSSLFQCGAIDWLIILFHLFSDFSSQIFEDVFSYFSEPWNQFSRLNVERGIDCAIVVRECDTFDVCECILSLFCLVIVYLLLTRWTDMTVFPDSEIFLPQISSCWSVHRPRPVVFPEQWWP